MWCFGTGLGGTQLLDGSATSSWELWLPVQCLEKSRLLRLEPKRFKEQAWDQSELPSMKCWRGRWDRERNGCLMVYNGKYLAPFSIQHQNNYPGGRYKDSSTSPRIISAVFSLHEELHSDDLCRQISISLFVSKYLHGPMHTALKLFCWLEWDIAPRKHCCIH